MRVAVTRALPAALATAERVRARGAEAIIAPLLTIVPCAFDTSTEDAQAILFTSSNGARAFPGVRDLPVLAVGDATAEAARGAGFTDVRSAHGDVGTLADLAKATLDPAKGKLIHIAGDHVAGDLAGALRAAGFRVERRQAYASVAATTLPEALSKPLEAIMFHSVRGAETFIALGAPNSREITAACLSPAVAEAAGRAPWRRIIVAPAPREDALLTALLGPQDSPAGASA